LAGSRYRVEVTVTAARQLRKLDPPIARRIQGAIEMLALDPRPPSSRQLRGRPGYRVRVGDYRLIYAIRDDVLVVVLIRVGHRRDAYDS
jgi:mRNA interferase RelE/StbE